ncbi:MAG: HNH endonuclease [Nitrospiraceae bacterium]
MKLLAHGIYRPTPIEVLKARFWNKVSPPNESGCRLWLGGVDRYGYGNVGKCRLSVLIGTRKAHRIAWIFTNGDPTPGLETLHSCDVPLCCEPSHLSEGTHQRNIADAHIRGRMPDRAHLKRRGGRNHNAKLTDAHVAGIRVLLSEGKSQTRIAKCYGVHQTLISLIKRGLR